MLRRVYISGPMTGVPDFNRPAFYNAAQRLRALGHHVENPAENAPPPCGSWEGWMRLAIGQLIRCNAIVMLDGWERSRSAVIEHRLARDLGIEVMAYG